MPQPAPVPVMAASDQRRPSPEVSVIVALPDDRGLALPCVESLVRGQTYPRDRFEVIVVTDGSNSKLDRRVKELLGLADRMISHATDTQHLILLYHVGAREARGRLLFFTESHCIAEPECLEELMKFFATHDYDGALCRIVAICRNALARMQGRLFDAGFRTWLRPGDWRKVTLQGFAIYRDIYLQAGGFEYVFHRFADWALAARLHSRGRRLGYAAGATVRHCYESDFRELRSFTRDFTRGECAYRGSAPAAYCERYFGYAEEWANRESLRPSTARAVCRANWRSLWGGGWALRRAQAGAWLRFLPAALLGPRWPLLQHRWSLWLAVARFSLWRWSDEGRYRAYCEILDRMIRYTRVECIAEQLAASGPGPPETLNYRLAETQEEWLVGFHAIEQWENESFRWSGPVALVRLGLPRGTYEVRLETRGVRAEPLPLCLRVFFNRHRVPSSSTQFTNGLLSFRIHPSMFEDGLAQRLILTCNPVRPWKFGVPDRRELGLPIFSIAFRPIENTVSGRDDLAASPTRPLAGNDRSQRQER